ncbi:hypothetical protein V6N11_081813 [Hibiscus sabdariffa]|uniref:BED-type domain-containing protein n=1 Tax=Hibiscus sabdariffa TaxID=183260 RepID=A0ABR2Q7N5_9ROSI
MSESQGQGNQISQSSSPSKVSGPTSTRNKSVQKQQQPRASCWSHFSKYVTEDGQKRARCNHCDTTYSMETRGSTTSLNNHMKVCLQKPKGNTSDIKQSELSFANVGDGPENPRRKMGFVDFGVQQLFPNVASEVMKMVERDLHCLFDEYSSTFGRVQDWLRKSKESINLDGYVAEDMEDELFRIPENQEAFSKMPMVHEEED